MIAPYSYILFLPLFCVVQALAENALHLILGLAIADNEGLEHLKAACQVETVTSTTTTTSTTNTTTNTTAKTSVTSKTVNGSSNGHGHSSSGTTNSSSGSSSSSGHHISPAAGGSPSPGGGLHQWIRLLCLTYPSAAVRRGVCHTLFNGCANLWYAI